MVIRRPFYIAAFVLAGGLSCSATQIPHKGSRHHKKFALINGQGIEVNMREVDVKRLPAEVTLSPDLLKAILLVLDYRQVHQIDLLGPIEKDRENFHYEARRGPKEGMVEVTLVPVPPVGWGFEWTDVGESHREAWYEVDLQRPWIVRFSFCSVKDTTCPPKGSLPEQ